MNTTEQIDKDKKSINNNKAKKGLIIGVVIFIGAISVVRFTQTREYSLSTTKGEPIEVKKTANTVVINFPDSEKELVDVGNIVAQTDKGEFPIKKKEETDEFYMKGNGEINKLEYKNQTVSSIPITDEIINNNQATLYIMNDNGLDFVTAYDVDSNEILKTEIAEEDAIVGDKPTYSITITREGYKSFEKMKEIKVVTGNYMKIGEVKSSDELFYINSDVGTHRLTDEDKKKTKEN